VTAKGDWLLAYVPVEEKGERTFTVDLSALSGTARARWFDPATGNTIAVAEGLVNTGTHQFMTPGRRDDGTDDWVLVLDTSGTSACGSITSTGTYSPPATTVPGVQCEVTATKVGDAGVIASVPAPSGGG